LPPEIEFYINLSVAQLQQINQTRTPAKYQKPLNSRTALASAPGYY